MTPVFSIGSLSVTPFALTVFAGAIIGVLLSLRKKGIVPVLPFVLAGALLFGHMWWVFFCPPGYSAEIGSLALMLRIWEGGYTLYGALFGGFIGAVLGAKAAKLSLLDTLDALSPGACAALVFCRLGEYFTGQGFGGYVEDESLWFFPLSFNLSQDVEFPDWYFAVWAWEAIAALVLLILLIARAKKAKQGQQAALFTAGLGVSQILLEQMREDDFVCLNPFVRFSQIAALISVIAVLIILFVRHRPTWKKILISSLELVFASLAIVFAEFVFQKPQFRPALYPSLGLTAVGFIVLLAAYRGKKGILPACLPAAATAVLLAVHIADRWEDDMLLLYGMMAVSLAAVGAVVYLNASHKNLSESACKA